MHPLDEKSSATNQRNNDTLSIEVCHPDATGQFTQASYDALVRLTAWLCDYCDIGRDRVIRHYDVTEKLCPPLFCGPPRGLGSSLRPMWRPTEGAVPGVSAGGPVGTGAG